MSSDGDGKEQELQAPGTSVRGNSEYALNEVHSTLLLCASSGHLVCSGLRAASMAAQLPVGRVRKWEELRLCPRFRCGCQSAKRYRSTEQMWILRNLCDVLSRVA